jgi:hypothetical protein
MEQSQPSRAPRGRDALGGAKPALYLAIGLGAVTGGSVVLVMIVVALLVSAAGGIGSGPSSLFALIGGSVGFWVGTSLGIILGVTVGFRAWVALYPAYERRTAAAERQVAVEEVEALLRAPDTD